MTTNTTLQLATSDGPCATELIAPEGPGPWPAVIVFHDAAGQRPVTTAMAERLAANGYLVAIPDLFHVTGSPSQLLPPGTPVTLENLRALFADPAMRARFLREYYAHAIAYDRLQATIGALLDHLAARDDTTGRVGTTGYCMGGNASFRAATLFGDRLAACAAFHPGWLVTDQPDSPHLRCAGIRARVLVAAARDDASLTVEAMATLDAALTAAGVEHAIETYPGRHGFAVPDNDVYDPACAARHDEALAALFAAALRRAAPAWHPGP